MISLNLPGEGVKLAHINICSLRNKITEVYEVLSLRIHLLAISETHLDDTFKIKYLLFRDTVFSGGIGIHVEVG